MMMDVNSFKELPVMGIARGIDTADIGPLLETVIGAGLRTIEITMNTPRAAEIISKANDISAGRIMVGAGTVLSMDDLNEAVDAGAGFIVMPVSAEDVIISCVKKGIPVFPGALTPQEVLNAWKAGAAMVKVFPSNVFGPGYLKALKGPFNDIKLMVVGGVRSDNIAEYFSCGADAVAFGASVFQKEWLAKKDFESIGELTAEYVRAVRAAVSQTNADLS